MIGREIYAHFFFFKTPEELVNFSASVLVNLLSGTTKLVKQVAECFGMTTYHGVFPSTNCENRCHLI